MSKKEEEENGTPHKGKSTAKWHMTKRVRKCSQRGE